MIGKPSTMACAISKRSKGHGDGEAKKPPGARGNVQWPTHLWYDAPDALEHTEMAARGVAASPASI